MKKESMIGRRLYAWIIDTLLFLVLLFFVDGLIATPIMNKTTNIEKVLDELNKGCCMGIDSLNLIMLLKLLNNC